MLLALEESKTSSTDLATAAGSKAIFSAATKSSRAIGIRSRVASPDSERARSRSWLIMVSSRRAFRCIASRAVARPPGGSSPRAMCSSGDIIKVSGVRSSWLMFEKKSVLARSSARTSSRVSASRALVSSRSAVRSSTLASTSSFACSSSAKRSSLARTLRRSASCCSAMDSACA